MSNEKAVLCRVLPDPGSSGEPAELLTTLFEQSPSFMAILEGPTHRIVRANANYLRLVGDRPILGRTVADALPDAQAQGYGELLDKVFNTGEAYSAFSAKYAVQTVAGGPVVEWFVDFVFQPLRDSDGTITGIFVEGYDVTDRTQVHAFHLALLRLSDEFQTLGTPEEFSFAACRVLGEALQVSRVGYGTIDPIAETLHVERDWTALGIETLAGVTPLREYGSFIDSLKKNEFIRIADVREDPRTSFAAAALESKSARSFMNVPVVEKGVLVAVLFVNHAQQRDWTETETTFMREVALRTRTAVERARGILDLQESELRLRAANESLEQRVQERTRALMEIEERFRQSQKMEAIGQLTGGIAHDFNNLLASMSVSMEVLEMRLKQGDTENAQRYIGMAKDSVKRAASLTQRLLAFSRRQTLDPKPMDVNRLIGNLEDLISRTVGPSVSVDVAGAGDLWLTKVDASQLENALLNLCINVRDAMTPAGGKLTIEAANKWLDASAAAQLDLAPGQYISIGVTDTGCGMSPETISRAFDPFFTTKPMGQGTGLGLSMVYGFVRQSGGQVHVASEIGRGTTMSLYLPRYSGGIDTESARASPEHLKMHADGECVLVVEDEETIREIIVESLTAEGYVVLSAASGVDGQKVFESGRKIDLLLTDVGLPGGMNGRQLADAARVRCPGLAVIFMTGYAEHAVVGKGFLEHGMAVVTKPFELGPLTVMIRSMIDGNRAMPDAASRS
ncbi:ATP-binding protein [Caballeronia sp. DA-9]|uniref:ATP-binding protein n=1 Tax=Caballeronia sp. DA-9 TaxID=3436237 RepID=UPI003F66EAB2